jgi:hypothetical protein
MKRYLPILLSIVMVGIVVFWAISSKNRTATHKKQMGIGSFVPQRSCARTPLFLHRFHIPQPVMIDLSQKRFKGIALLYGKQFNKVLHPKQWEQYEHFSTYALDKQGNIYLIPTPFISIRPTTFNLQKNIYKLDTHTGNISIFMEVEPVTPSAQNPYGLNAVAYDCDDDTLWVASIDQSDYREQKGVIYHISPQTKQVLQKVKGFDALTLSIIHTSQGKKLLVGSARDNGLYAFDMRSNGLEHPARKVLEIPDPNAHIRKIRIGKQNRLLLETIPFAYSLIAQTAKEDRTLYEARWLPEKSTWSVEKKSHQ